eukprot:TRINITY_DN6393_c0_g1_i1.p1 TRINITY_DN6393_c0_g1~~TRINITY_DN6393_c0_g1_i1.p1  ORF type:complete len:218 (-),score=106.11 TRINITY_DN6393_c0_g1_i1:36-689(-)
MFRFFGTSKPAPPTPTLSEMGDTLEKRVSVLDDKIKKLENEISIYGQKMKQSRNPTQQAQFKQKAMALLQQKKNYEAQRNQISQQSMNLEQTNFTLQNMQMTAATITTMKQANKELKKQLGSVKISDIDNLYDEMEDLMDTTNDIQEAMSRSFAVPEYVDEADLEAELASLGDDIEVEQVPSYLMTTPSVGNPLESTTSFDAFGLPEVQNRLISTTK